jgi:hypothetical protein
MGANQHSPTAITATMFMVVVTFVVASTTALAFTGILEDTQRQSPAVAFDVAVSDGSVVVTHEQGDSVEVAALELVVRHAGGVERIPFASFASDSQMSLDAGDTVTRHEGLPPDTIELRIVHDGETVLYERSFES